MLRLVFYTHDRLLKVRPASSEDSFEHSYHWKNKLEFIISSTSDFMMTWTSLVPDLDPAYAQALVNLVGARYPVSQEYEKLKGLCPEILFKNPTDEWVFFGGTFDPWHQGHQACISLLPDDKVCLITPDRNPHKELRVLDAVATILEISTNAKFKKCQFLVPTFLLEHRPNPTVTWVESLKDRMPTQKISLLLGFDSFSRLKTWTRCEDLLPLLHTLYVVSRLEDDEDRRLALDEAHARGPELNIVFLGKHEFESVSSSEIRLNGRKKTGRPKSP